MLCARRFSVTKRAKLYKNRQIGYLYAVVYSEDTENLHEYSRMNTMLFANIFSFKIADNSLSIMLSEEARNRFAHLYIVNSFSGVERSYTNI